MAAEPATDADAVAATETAADADAASMSDSLRDIPYDRFMAFLQEISEIAAANDPVDIAMIVIDHTCKVLGVDRTSFFFVDGEYLDLVIAKGVDSIRMPKASGFAGLCATTGETVNIPDAYQDDRFNSDFDKKSGYKTKQILCVPVRDPSKNIVGVLQAINKKDDTSYDSVDESMLLSIGQQVGLALRSAEQLEEARHAKKQKDSLVKYIKNISTSATTASVLFSLNSAASELLDADRCSLFIVDSQAGNMHLASSDASVDIKLPIGKGIAGSVAETGMPIIIEDAYLDDRFDQTWDKKTGYRTRSMLVLPVWSDPSVEQKPMSAGSSKALPDLVASSSGGPSGHSGSSASGKISIVKEDAPDMPEAPEPVKKPCAVVQLINKTEEEAVFDREDEELLEVLLKFLSPVVSQSALFIKKQKVKEASKLQDLSKASLKRIASCDLQLEADAIMEEEEGSEPDDW